MNDDDSMVYYIEVLSTVLNVFDPIGPNEPVDFASLNDDKNMEHEKDVKDVKDVKPILNLQGLQGLQGSRCLNLFQYSGNSNSDNSDLNKPKRVFACKGLVGSRPSSNQTLSLAIPNTKNRDKGKHV